MSKSYYMHTLDGKPAYFWNAADGDGGQIVFANGWHGVAKLEPSLRAIRRNEQATQEFKARHGLRFGDVRYGYIRIPKSAIPEPRRQG